MYRGRFPRPQVDERERFYEREHLMYERERAGYERAPHYDERAPAPDEAAYHKVCLGRGNKMCSFRIISCKRQTYYEVTFRDV